jgi:crotonobetainyl-CoA:carnitine CoA-transferase CaiB-like acyl-CoA transferase
VQAAVLANQAANFFATGKAPGRLGNAHPNLAPYQVFATADGAMVIAVGNDEQFRGLCRGVGDESLGGEADFLSNALRVANRQALAARLQPPLSTRTTAQWLESLAEHGVPCGPINTIAQVFEEPQAMARDLVVEQVREDLVKPVRTVASPLRLSLTPPAYDRPPPSLGQHTHAILAEKLGLTDEQISDLVARGVI